MNTTYARREAAHQCLKCGARRDNQTKHCTTCREAEHARQEGQSSRRRLRLIAAGLCAACGGPKNGATTLTCLSCAERERDRNRPRSKELSKQRKAGGLCFACGIVVLNGATRCPSCAATAADRCRKAKSEKARELEDKGACWKCAAPWDVAAAKCTSCDNTRTYEQRQLDLAIRGARKDLGVCVVCSAEHAGETHTCEACIIRRRAIQHKSYTKKKAERPHICKVCAGPVFHKSRKCKHHWIYSLLHNYTRGSVPAALIELMSKRLSDSGFKCAYSGLPIIPGESASIEHIYSRKLFPHLAAEPNNMVWVHNTANWLKQENDPRDPTMLALLHPDIAARITALASAIDPTPPARPEEHPVA